MNNIFENILKNVMIFSPHEDDESICCAGIIRRCVINDSNIKLVLVTTGDHSDAKGRLQKTISAMELLGLKKEHIIYLGYGDYDVLGPAYRSKDTPQQIFPGRRGNKTYGFPSLNIIDYHYKLHETHAFYTYENILNDIYNLLS